jgi:hypothetical protein
VRVRRTVPLLAALVLASILAIPGQGAASKSLTFKVRLIQEQTIRHHKSSDGEDHTNDTFSTQLRLFTIVSTLGISPNTPIGTMEFNWGPLNGSCTTSGSGCSGTTNITTFTKLPGGTLTAGGKNVSLSKGIIVPVTIGTGIFKGATGTIDIAPSSVAEDVFNLKLPAS